MGCQERKENLYVVGHPVAHSKSPDMHNAVYKALGLPWHYGRKDCIDEASARSFFKDPSWLALNITMPYKPLAFDLATNPTDYAVMAQGANVLIRTEDRLYADNTDGRGCISYLERRGCDFRDTSVVVCGTGPTSQSILYAALKSGVRSAYLLSRDAARAQMQLDAFKNKLSDKHLASNLFAGSYNQDKTCIEEAQIIIDATSLGMNQDDPAPFDTCLLQSNQTVFDVVYGHGVTALIQAAQAAGCKAYDGSGMLVAQAVQTVYDIQDVLHIPITLDASELFLIMAEAAGFTNCL